MPQAFDDAVDARDTHVRWYTRCDPVLDQRDSVLHIDRADAHTQNVGAFALRIRLGVQRADLRVNVCTCSVFRESKLSKYAMVRFSPSSRGTLGCHRSNFLARVMSGQRCFGSSGGGPTHCAVTLTTRFTLEAGTAHDARQLGNSTRETGACPLWGWGGVH